MILTPHLVIGAAIAAKTTYWPVAIVLAFLSHYFLDFFPHVEYQIENIKKRQWRKIKPDVLRIFLDLTAGLMLVFSIQQLTDTNYLIIFTAALSAILPDALIVLYLIFPKNKILKKNFDLHQKIHFPKNKKFSHRWRILIQIVFVVLGFVVLL